MSSGGGGSFISKPARGWLHSDNQVTKEGITYAVRYIGCLEVYTSMKSLDFETRSCVAKECINRVCEAAGLKSADKKRRVDRKVLKAIADKPRMEHAGANINLIISSCSLALTMLDTGAIVAKHDMPRISFASGGDTDTLDFVAYIAKDLKDWRACYVLECGGGLAQDVIATIGQAFELRFKEFLTKPSTALTSPRDADRDYYNDLPGKVPPDIGPPPVPPLPINASTLPNLKHHSNHNHGVAGTSQCSSLTDTLSSNRGRQVQQWPETGNLIDLSSDTASAISSSSIIVEHNYVNDTVIAANRDTRREQRDAFDMQPFNTAIPEVSKLSPQSQKQQLKREIWFHGSISRAEAESMLTKDGDFLVRESQGSPGQYVLTGMNGGTPRHLLLIDPEGVVRTKDRVFDSVSHLINDHCDNALPIISADSTLVLRYPVHRRLEQASEGRK
ncbi:SHC-transforming protein 1 [Diprion similis]|uniref:SHC-transforming protein 1 n=1 Tax=Diprion similis TaxID=362088 RepID=UPI001EF9316C|nr:SHC-transforming protein 1 [Diprion similis]XP_046752264.1 SHC-transforming protein 1 [Diprion similis]XP_046752265.1 SHC-transforming protein 1 [Diprion similis]